VSTAAQLQRTWDADSGAIISAMTQPSEPFERAVRRAAKDWPLDPDKLGRAATAAIEWLIDGLEEELVADFYSRVMDGRLELRCIHDWNDDQVALTISDAEPFCTLPRELVVSTPQG
jgi:hypothetical protein